MPRSLVSLPYLNYFPNFIVILKTPKSMSPALASTPNSRSIYLTAFRSSSDKWRGPLTSYKPQGPTEIPYPFCISSFPHYKLIPPPSPEPVLPSVFSITVNGIISHSNLLQYLWPNGMGLKGKQPWVQIWASSLLPPSPFSSTYLQSILNSSYFPLFATNSSPFSGFIISHLDYCLLIGFPGLHNHTFLIQHSHTCQKWPFLNSNQITSPVILKLFTNSYFQC